MLDAEERRRAEFERKHPDLCAYDRLEQTLRDLLTGKKLPFNIFSGHVVIISARRKITNTMIERLIKGRDKFATDPSAPHPTADKILDAFRVYDREMAELVK